MQFPRKVHLWLSSDAAAACGGDGACVVLTFGAGLVRLTSNGAGVASTVKLFLIDFLFNVAIIGFEVTATGAETTTGAGVGVLLLVMDPFFVLMDDFDACRETTGSVEDGFKGSKTGYSSS